MSNPQQWVKTPIRRQINPVTKMIEGDDKGYRGVKTLPRNPSPLVVPNVLIRASYDGVDEYGRKRSEIALPGGLRDGVLVVREQVARELELANECLRSVFGGELQICAQDGFRSYIRQKEGFKRMLLRWLSRLGLPTHEVDNDVLRFLEAGNAADGTFSWVNAKVKSSVYEELVEELQRDDKFMTQIRAYAAILAKGGPVTKDHMDEALYTYITVSSNSGLGRATRSAMDFEGNAHAGGGAVDLMLVDRQGRLISIVPFDYPGDEAGIDFTESDENYDLYIARASEESDAGTMLRNHLNALGFATPAAFTRNHWNHHRNINRVGYWLAKGRGWTYYSSAHGGERWHFEPGNIGRSALTGEVETMEKLTAELLPDAGNPGHTLQMVGADGIAVWGGASGHLAAVPWGLEA